MVVVLTLWCHFEKLDHGWGDGAGNHSIVAENGLIDRPIIASKKNIGP